MKFSDDVPVCDQIIEKYGLKYQVYNNTAKAFKMLKDAAQQLFLDNHKKVSKSKVPIQFDYRDLGEFHFELKFGSDTLVFLHHTNVFDFDRSHEVRKTPYTREDPDRTYCGVIQIYNFLSDSYKYNRINDLGYMIARVFVNKENHYFIEGKKEIGLLYNEFAVAEMKKDIAKDIIESAMKYCVNFDLLTPPFDSMKEVTLMEMQDYTQNMRMTTGKRMGFQFQADKS